MANDKQSLVIHFVSHKDDEKETTPLIEVLCSAFSRNPAYPYSRELNIPIFTWKGADFAEHILDEVRLGSKTVVFAFTSSKSCIDKSWTKSLDSLNKRAKKIYVVPIAINVGGVSIPFKVGFNNVISFFKWDFFAHEMLALSAAQAICQLCYGSSKARTVSRLKVFLSHTKSDDVGARVVKQLRNFICEETSLAKFIDINDILAGEAFDRKIYKEIKNSAFLAIVTDNYSTRRWCQLEAVDAKASGVPILVMNCVTRAEDRILPALANVPSIRPSLNLNTNEAILTQAEIVRVMMALMIETLRCSYQKERLKLFLNGVDVCCRPPEADALKKGSSNAVIYPDPPLLEEELEFYFGKHTNFVTPSSCDACGDISKLKVGLSISDPEPRYLSDIGQRQENLLLLSQDIARNIVSRGVELIYGGDFRPQKENGFTGMLFDEAKIVKQRYKVKHTLIRNFLAWPLYRKRTDEEIDFLNRYKEVSECVLCDPPSDISNIPGFKKEEYCEPDTVESRYFWSRSLTAMREQLIKASDYRICAGGKFTKYKGSMPGVLEEVIIANRAKQPIFLLGGFGGVTEAIVSSIRKRSVDSRLTLTWQEKNSLGYADLVEFSKSQSNPIDYAEVAELGKLTIKKLADRVGLSEKEYERLMVSPFVDECVHLILKGLSALKFKKANRKKRRA